MDPDLREIKADPQPWKEYTHAYQQDAPGGFGEGILVPDVRGDPVPQRIEVVQQVLVGMLKLHLSVVSFYKYTYTYKEKPHSWSAKAPIKRYGAVQVNK